MPLAGGTFTGQVIFDDTAANAGIQWGTGADFTISRSGTAAKFNAGSDLDHYEFCIGGTETRPCNYARYSNC
jgi:hypothetical protein